MKTGKMLAALWHHLVCPVRQDVGRHQTLTAHSMSHSLGAVTFPWKPSPPRSTVFSSPLGRTDWRSTYFWIYPSSLINGFLPVSLGALSEAFLRSGENLPCPTTVRFGLLAGAPRRFQRPFFKTPNLFYFITFLSISFIEKNRK